LIFNVVAETYERRSVWITTNLAFAEWPRVLGRDGKLAAAVLDRLAHLSTVRLPAASRERLANRSVVHWRHSAARGPALRSSQRKSDVSNSCALS
jgi:hypothetical protein